MVTTLAAPPADAPPGLDRRLVELDGIRGIAAMMVVLSHTSFVVLRGGFVGVDVFFVLSGFIITGLLLGDVRRHGRVRLARFWARRATRLLPAALLVIVVVVVLSLLLDGYTTRQATFVDARAGALYVENWHLIASGSDYFGESLAPSRLRHYWSLAVEEQFYVVWPLLLMALATRSRWARVAQVRPGRILVPIGVLGVASYLLALALDDGTGLQAYMGTFSRAWQLLLGAGIAVAWRVTRGWVSRDRSDLLALGGAVLLAVACVYATATTFLPLGALLAAGGSAALIVALVAPGPRSTVVFASGPLQYLGGISYSVYLWHWPAVIYTPRLIGMHRNAVLLTVVEVGVTLVAATLSLRYVETPLRHLRVREVRPLLTVVVAVGVSVAVAVAATGVARLDTRAVEKATGIDLVAVAKDHSVVACAHQPTPCVRHTGHSGLVVATVGDSTMQHYDPALRKLATKDDFTYVQAAMGGCAISHKFLATGIDALHKQSNYDCRDWIPGAYRTLLDTYDPDVILVTSSNERSPYVDDAGQVLQPGDPAHVSGTRAGITESLTLLASQGAVVVTVDQLVRGKGTDCLADGTVASCTTRVADDPLTAEYNQVLRSAAAAIPRARSISMLDEVCPDGTCAPVLDGRFVRYDGGHFTGSFSRFLAAPLAARLAAVGVRLKRS